MFKKFTALTVALIMVLLSLCVTVPVFADDNPYMLLSSNADSALYLKNGVQKAENNAEYRWQTDGSCGISRETADKDNGNILINGKNDKMVIESDKAEAIFDLKEVFALTELNVFTVRNDDTRLESFEVMASTDGENFNLVETKLSDNTEKGDVCEKCEILPSVYARYVKLIFKKGKDFKEMALSQVTMYGYGNCDILDMTEKGSYNWVTEQPFVTGEDMINSDKENGGSSLTDGNVQTKAQTSEKNAAALFELTEACQISDIEVIADDNDTAKLSGIEVKTSRDGFRYFTLGYFPADSLSDGLSVTHASGLPARNARFIKLVFISGADNMAVNEVKISGYELKGTPFEKDSFVNARAEIINYNTIDVDFSGSEHLGADKYALYTEKENFNDVSGLTPVKVIEAGSREEINKYAFYYNLEPEAKYYFAVTPFINGSEVKKVKTKSFVTPPAMGSGEKMKTMFCLNDYPSGGGADIGHGDYTDKDRVERLKLKAELGVRRNRWWGLSDDIFTESREYGINYSIMGMNQAKTIINKNQNGIWAMMSDNEPDNAQKDPATQFKSIQSSYKITKSQDKRNTMYDPTLTGTLDTNMNWLRRFYNSDNQGGSIVRQMFDAFDIHVYCKPEDGKVEGITLGAPEMIDYKIRKLKGVLAEFGDENKPMVATEMGWPTYDKSTANSATSVSFDTQGEYLPRAYMMMASWGFREVYWYSFRSEGVKSDNSEENYGIVDWFDIPKPAYYSYYTMSTVLGNSEFVRRLPMISTPYYGMEFWDEYKNSYITTAWTSDDTTRMVVVSPVGDETELTMIGHKGEIRTLEVKDGKAIIPISGAPVYIYSKSGVKLSASANAFYSSNDKRDVKRGESVKVEIVKSPTTEAGSYSVKTTLPEGFAVSGNTEFTQNDDKVTFDIIVPRNAEEKEYPINIGVYSKDMLQANITQNVNVRKSVALDFKQEIGQDKDVVTAAYVTNLLDEPFNGTLSVGKASYVEIDRVPVNIENLKPGETQRYELKMGKLPLKENAMLGLCVKDSDYTLLSKEKKYNYSIALNDGKAPKIDGVISDGEWNVEAVALTEKDQTQAFNGWAGPEDLSGYAYTKWDDKNFYIAVDVIDNVQCQTGTGEDIWSGDSIQFALDPGRNGDSGSSSYDEIGMALGASGFIGWKWMSRGNYKPGRLKCEAKAVRNGTHTVYEMAVPWEELLGGTGLTKDLRKMGFSLLINDNDGAGRRGWIKYMDGIGSGKNSSLFADIVLGEY